MNLKSVLKYFLISSDLILATCLFSIRLILKSFVLSVRVHTQTLSGRSYRPECHTYILVFVWHSGPIDRPLIVWVWNFYLWRWRQYIFFETLRTIHSTQNVQYQKTGIPVKYATPKTSNHAGFCRIMDATILSRHYPSWAAHVSVSGAGLSFDVSNTHVRFGVALGNAGEVGVVAFMDFCLCRMKGVQ